MKVISKGNTALITGASSGIGEAFAHSLAEQGLNLILVARSEGKLNALKSELEAKYRINAHVLAVDLTDTNATHRITSAITRNQWNVHLLVNNAGAGTHGAFEELEAERLQREILLNVNSLVALTRELLPAMTSRRLGGIINVASTAAFQPIPLMAVYGACKAFVLSFSEALYHEVSPAGVRVVALCPGYTKTHFHDELSGGQVGKARTPEQVVATGLRALERNQMTAVDGFANWLLGQTPRFMPRAMVVKIAAAFMKQP